MKIENEPQTERVLFKLLFKEQSDFGLNCLPLPYEFFVMPFMNLKCHDTLRFCIKLLLQKSVCRQIKKK